MPKSRVQKQSETQDVVDRVAKSKAIVFATQKNVSVKEMEVLRRELRSINAEFQTIKKTLLKRAFKDSNIEVDLTSFSGTVGMAFSYADEVSAAKLLATFAKKNGGMVLVGGVLEGKSIDATVVKTLASLPGKQELLAQLVGVLQGPTRGFAQVLSGTIRNMIQVMNAIKESKTI